MFAIVLNTKPLFCSRTSDSVLMDPGLNFSFIVYVSENNSNIPP